MKKTLLTLALISVIILIAATFFKSLSKGNAHILLPVKQKAEDSSSRVDQLKMTEATSNVSVTSSDLSKQNHASINQQITNDITTTITTKDRTKRNSELIRLADIHVENDLLQYLASTNCINDKIQPCDAKRFAHRLLALNPDDAVAKSLLVNDSLNSKDLETALTLLATIKPTDDFNSYFTEVTETVIKGRTLQIQNNEYLIEELKARTNSNSYFDLPETLSDSWIKELVTVEAFGVAAAQLFNGKVAMTCFSETKSNPQKNRWVEACHDYGLSMQNSKNANNQFFGYKLQLKMLEMSGDIEAAWQIQKKIAENTLVLEQAGKYFLDRKFFTENFDTYYSDLKEYGELEAMKRLIERESSN